MRSYCVALCSLLALLLGGCAGGKGEASPNEGSQAVPREPSVGEREAPDEAQDDARDGGDPPTAGSEQAPSVSLTPLSFEPVDSDDDAYEMPAGDGVGFRVTGLSEQGWSRSKGPSGELMLSGPPGGPLGFEVRRYDVTQGDAELEEVFGAWYSETPDAKSDATQVELAGSKRSAQAFRTGESLATTATCIVDIQAKTTDKGGLWVRFYVGAGEGQAPSCEAVLKHPAFLAITRSFELVE